MADPDWLHGEPCSVPAALYELAAEYVARCEAYDRTVCTGRTDARGVVYPANARELALIGDFSRAVWVEVKRGAEALGYTGADLKREITRQER